MLEWDISYADACFLCCCFGCFSLFWGGKPRLAADSSGRRAVEGVRRAGRAAGARCAGAARSKPGFFPVHPAGAWDASCMWDRAVR